MNTENIENIHVSPLQISAADRTNTTLTPTVVEPQLPRQGHMALARSLIASSIRERKFRSHSFVAKLTNEQRLTLFNWLQTDSTPEVRARVAAAPPEGFGLQVSLNTLVRLRNTLKNTQLNQWIATAMDAACDIMDADTSADVAPLRESMSLLLHAHALNYIRQQADPVSIDRLITSIGRLDKLNRRARSNSPSRPAAARHHLDVTIKTHRGNPTPVTIEATHCTLPPQSAPETSP
jgi:hypothetical protein